MYDLEREEFNYSNQYGSIKNEIYDWVEMFVFAIICIVLVFTFVVRTVSVNGSSMDNTLQNGDKLLSSRFIYTPSYGDIVVVTKPNYLGEPLIKRIVATSGQTVEIDGYEGIVKIDGTIIDEPYIPEPTNQEGDIFYPLTVPEGFVFVMGDNRNHSLDSRYSEIGLIDERYILGRVIYRVGPWASHGHPDDYWKKEQDE